MMGTSTTIDRATSYGVQIEIFYSSWLMILLPLGVIEL
jgi:hypothetical protein